MANNKVVEITYNDFAIKGGEEGIQKCMLEAAIKVLAEAESLAPVDKGQLRNSIMYTINKEEGGFNNSSGEKAKDKLTVNSSKYVGYVGTNLDYAVYQEFGTRNQIAQPFLRPAGEVVKNPSQAGEIAKKYGRAAMEEEYKKRKVVKK